MNSLTFFRRVLLVLLLSVSAGAGRVLADRPADDFVQASVVVTSPGDALYSSTGHAFFRMRCPAHGMDFCFSYESENIDNRVLTFLAGNLRMGMAVVRTEEFVKSYAGEGRGVWEYPLTLPIEMKQNLWRVLDNHVDEGMELPYDYLERGCAISVLHILEEAIGKRRISYGEWPEEFVMSRRELLASELSDDPWARAAINVLTNGKANEDVPFKEKAITPRMLIKVLGLASVGGRPILAAEPYTLVEPSQKTDSTWCTPMVLAIIALVLTVVCALIGKHWMLYTMLAVQSALGLLNVYLVLFSSLCATEWSWLLIPFNPLPLILWKWRRIWELPFAAVITVWTLAMTMTTTQLTDPALIILALAVATAFAGDALASSGYPLSRFGWGQKYNKKQTTLKPI